MITPRPSSPLAAELARTKAARRQREAQRAPLALARQLRLLQALAHAAGTPLRDLRALTDPAGRPALSAELLGHVVTVRGQHAHLWRGGQWVRVTPHSWTRLQAEPGPPPPDRGALLSGAATSRLRALAAWLRLSPAGPEWVRPYQVLTLLTAAPLFCALNASLLGPEASPWMLTAAQAAPGITAASVLTGVLLAAGRPALARAVTRALPNTP